MTQYIATVGFEASSIDDAQHVTEGWNIGDGVVQSIQGAPEVWIAPPPDLATRELPLGPDERPTGHPAPTVPPVPGAIPGQTTIDDM